MKVLMIFAFLLGMEIAAVIEMHLDYDTKNETEARHARGGVLSDADRCSFMHEGSSNMRRQVQIGETAKDQITGFSGICTATAEYITGCRQVLLQPKIKKDSGDFVESRWVDDDRLEILDVPIVTIKVQDAGPDKPAPRR